MTEKRLKTETEIFRVMNVLDNTGYNAEIYKKAFSKMTDNAFDKYMKDINAGKEHLVLEIDTMKDTMTLNSVYKMGDKLGVKTHQYVSYPHRNIKNPANAPVSPTPVPILTVPIYRLQQMLSKKNAASSNTDIINPITGQVTGDSKTASITDTLTYSLVAVGLKNSVKEFLGPRSDDPVSKMQMLKAIERNGDFTLEELNMKSKNKQSIETMNVFLKGAGFRITN